MAVDSPKPASRGRSSRLTVAGRLTALVGLPTLVIVSIFGSGLYVGATRSYRVQSLEASWLGMAPPVGAGGIPDSSPKPAAAKTDGPESADTSEPANAASPDAEVEPVPPKPEPETKPKDPTPDVAPSSEPVANERLPVASPDPVGAELRTLFDEQLTIRVKIVVDPKLALTRGDWLSYAAQLFSSARTSYARLAGIDLQLQGIVLWDVDTNADAATLLGDLEQRERDGADVVLGLVVQPEPEGVGGASWGASWGPSWTAAQNGDFALVFPDGGRSDPYYFNTLRALGTLLGAEPTSEAAGSFMSSAAPDSTPVLDPDNRGKIIINKRRPFADSRVEPEASDDAQGDD